MRGSAEREERAPGVPPPRSRTTGGGDKRNKGSPSILCTENLWKPVVGGHRAMVHERTGRGTKDLTLRGRDGQVWEMPAAVNDREGVPPRGGNTTGGKNLSVMSVAPERKSPEEKKCQA